MTIEDNTILTEPEELSGLTDATLSGFISGLDPAAFNNFASPLGLSAGTVTPESFGSGLGVSQLPDASAIRVFDTVTNREISLAEAIQLDPNNAMSLIASTPQLAGLIHPNVGGDLAGLQPADTAAQLSSQPGGGGLLNWIKNNPAQAAALGLTAGVAGVGLLGTIQQAIQGKPAAVTEVKRILDSASPEEKAAFGEALKGIANTNQFAFGSPLGLQSQLGARVPTEENAFNQNAAGLVSQGNMARNALNTLGPNLVPGLNNLFSGQSSILNALAPTATAMAGGSLNLSPELSRTVEQAFTPQLGDLATQLIEAARGRGFSGGADLLAQAPAMGIGATALRDLQGQIAAAKLNLALQLPQAAASIAGASSIPEAIRLSGFNNLASLNQNVLAALGNIGQAGISNRTDFLRAATAPASAASGAGSNLASLRLGGAGQSSTATQGTNLLDAFSPLASLLAGAGGVLSGVGALSNPRTSSLNLRLS